MNTSYLLNGPTAPQLLFSNFPDPTLNTGKTVAASDQNNALYVSNGTNWVQIRVAGQTRVAAIISDSIMGGGNGVFNIQSITVAGTTATFNATNHSLRPGTRFICGTGTTGNYDGLRTVATVLSVNAFTVTMPNTMTVGESVAMTGTVENYFTDRNFYEMANALAGHPIAAVYNRGIQGQTSAQILARLNRDVLSVLPGLHRLIICAGTNDALQSAAGSNPVTVAQTVANINSMIQMAFGAGVEYVDVCIPPPNNTATNALAANKYLLNLRQQLLKLCSQYDHVFPWSLYDTLVNATSTTLPFTSALTFDGTHPNATGAGLIATSLYASSAMAVYNHQILPRALSVLDNFTNDSANINLMNNGLMQGAGGTVGTNASGTAPNNTSLSTTSANVTVVSAVGATAQTGGQGNDWTLTITATGAGVVQAYLDFINALCGFGDTLSLEMLVTVSNITGSPACFFDLFCSDTANNFFTASAALAPNGQGGVMAAGTYLLQSLPYTKDLGPVALGAVNQVSPFVQVNFAAAGTITLKIACASVLKNY